MCCHNSLVSNILMGNQYNATQNIYISLCLSVGNQHKPTQNISDHLLKGIQS